MPKRTSDVKDRNNAVDKIMAEGTVPKLSKASRSNPAQRQTAMIRNTDTSEAGAVGPLTSLRGLRQTRRHLRNDAVAKLEALKGTMSKADFDPETMPSPTASEAATMAAYSKSMGWDAPVFKQKTAKRTRRQDQVDRLPTSSDTRPTTRSIMRRMLNRTSGDGPPLAGSSKTTSDVPGEGARATNAKKVKPRSERITGTDSNRYSLRRLVGRDRTNVPRG